MKWWMEGALLAPEEDDAGGGDVAVEDAPEEVVSEEVSEEPAGPAALDDEAQYSWEGLDEPLTGKDVREGWLRHKDYTQKTQEIAAQQKAYQEQIQNGQKWMEYAQNLQRQMEQLQAAQNQAPQQAQQADALEKLWASVQAKGGYPDANDLQTLWAHAEQNSFGPMMQRQQFLEESLAQVLGDYLQTKNQLGEILQSRGQDQEKDLVAQALAFAEVDEALHEDASEFARDQLLSYEPDESAGETLQTFHAQFPSLFRERWEKMMQISRARDKSDLERAKKGAAPKKGGTASPSKPVKPKEETPGQITDKFFVPRQG